MNKIKIIKSHKTWVEIFSVTNHSLLSGENVIDPILADLTDTVEKHKIVSIQIQNDD